MQRWLLILFAVFLGWFPTAAQAHARTSQAGYDAGQPLEKVVVVVGITGDTHHGSRYTPLSLHKYLYCRANPVNRVDPSGHDDFNVVSVELAPAEGVGIDTGATVVINQSEKEAIRDIVRIAALVGATIGSQQNNIKVPYYHYDKNGNLTSFGIGTYVTSKGNLSYDRALSITMQEDVTILYMYTLLVRLGGIDFPPEGGFVGDIPQFILTQPVLGSDVTLTRTLTPDQ